jgi:hypothetical protein
VEKALVFVRRGNDETVIHSLNRIKSNWLRCFCLFEFFKHGWGNARLLVDRRRLKRSDLIREERTFDVLGNSATQNAVTKRGKLLEGKGFLFKHDARVYAQRKRR